MVTAPGKAEEGAGRVTIGTPARIPIAPPSDRASTPDRPLRVVVSVTGFTPSSDGPVGAVVTIPCGAEEREIGRFAIFPNTAFSASQPSKIQRFGFALPDDAECARPTSVSVRLEARMGDGRSADLTIGGATYQ